MAHPRQMRVAAQQKPHQRPRSPVRAGRAMADVVTSGRWTGLRHLSVMSWCGDLPVQRQFGCCVGSTLTDRLTTSTPAILVQTDAPWRVVACNQKWEQLCGYSAQEACGQPPSLLHGPCTDKALTEGHRTACVTEGAARMLIVNYTKGGRPFAHR
eukprot:3610109-Prymnesium_polylepis.1